MKVNFIFLIVAISLSVLSKVLQFVYKSKIGDVVVILAAIFFVLAVLFSIGRFQVLFEQERHFAWLVIFLSCVAVVCFQLTMLVGIGYGQKWGGVFILPFIVSVVVLLYKVFL